MGQVTDLNALIERSGLSQWHLDNWPDGAFKEHIPEVRKALRELVALRTLAERQPDHSSDVRNMVQAAEQRGADRAFEEAVGICDTLAKKHLAQTGLILAAKAIRQRIGGQ